MKPVELTRWEEYKSHIDTLRPVRSRYLFRGLADAEYKLETTFDRKFNETETPEESREEIRKRLLDYFRRECQHYPQYKETIKDPITCEALAQHYGLPTRLLDWTESPYVAAYFAFQERLFADPNRDKSVAIWILDRKITRCWTENRENPEDGRVRLISPDAWHNERMQHQSGWFTLAKLQSPRLEEYVGSMKGSDGALSKVILPAIEAGRAISDLDLMGINARELFADLSGAARNAYVRTVLDYPNPEKIELRLERG